MLGCPEFENPKSTPACALSHAREVTCPRSSANQRQNRDGNPACKTLFLSTCDLLLQGSKGQPLLQASLISSEDQGQALCLLFPSRQPLLLTGASGALGMEHLCATRQLGQKAKLGTLPSSPGWSLSLCPDTSRWKPASCQT